MAGNRTLVLNLATDTQQFNRGLQNSERELERWGRDVDRVGNGAAQDFSRSTGIMSGAGAAMGAAIASGAAVAAVGLGLLVKDSVEAASDLNEALSKNKVVFGDQAAAIEQFSKDAAASLGQSQVAALEAASTFALYGKAAGLTGTELTAFSEKLVILASDMASFSNTSPEEAVEALGAALRGEFDPIEKYGVLLNEASIQAEAMALGIIKTTNEALSPQQRVLAVQSAILKQTGDAQGDFERTSEGLANQQRILKAEFENLSAAIGEIFIPIVLNAVEGSRELVNELLALVSGSEDTAKAQEGLARVMEGVGEVISSIVDPAWEGLKSAVSDVTAEVKEDDGAWSTLGDLLKDVIAPILGGTLKTALESAGEFVAFVTDEAGDLIDEMIGSNGLENATDSVSKALEFLNDVFDGIVKFIKGILEPVFEGLKDAFKSVRETTNENRDSLEKVFAVFQAVGRFLRDTLAPFLGGALKLAFKAMGEYISAVITIIDGLVKAIETVIGWIQSLIGWIGSIQIPDLSGLNPFSATLTVAADGAQLTDTGATSLLAAPTGRNASTLWGAGVIININGAIDPDATARQIRKLLTDYDLRAGIAA